MKSLARCRCGKTKKFRGHRRRFTCPECLAARPAERDARAVENPDSSADRGRPQERDPTIRVHRLHETSAAVLDDLVARIKRLPGAKIVTLSLEGSEFAIDVDPQGTCGYHPGHEPLFKTMLARALLEGGGLIVRQFLPVKIERRMPNGKLMWVPAKKLYGLALGHGALRGLDAEEVRAAMCTDADSGAPLPVEEGVVYAAWES
jgi:hypothetical protein